MKSMKPTRASIANRQIFHEVRVGLVWVVCVVAVVLGCSQRASNESAKPATGSMQAPSARVSARSASKLKPYQGVLVNAELASDENLKKWKSESSRVVLVIDDGSPEERQEALAAARRLAQAGFEPEYWVEVARCPNLADSHPEWMCSLQGHDEWRRLFPDLKPPQSDEVVKNYPWVPILYEESFAAQRDRILALLDQLPPPRRLWLNDLQGGPSACGCGHPLCRWTADYGPIRTATPLGDDGAAEFVRAIAEKVPATEIVPVWTTECEAADEHESCGGVGCFDGICWQAYTRQLMHLEKVAPRIGVLCFYKAFRRDLPRYGAMAAWVEFALRTFQEMPPQRQGQAIQSNRLLAVVQGWDVDDAERQSQIRFAMQAGAAGYLIAEIPVEQNWEPRPFKLADLKQPD
jgi:hypothetical protein